MLAKQFFILCGSKRIAQSGFFLLHALNKEKQSKKRLSYAFPTAVAQLSLDSEHLRFFQTLASFRESISSSSNHIYQLEELLGKFCEFECQERRDKVYGVLGLCSSQLQRDAFTVQITLTIPFRRWSEL
jgi:hypothetical protein